MGNTLRRGLGLASLMVLLGSALANGSLVFAAEGIEGKWKPISVEQGGKAFPGDATKGEVPVVEFSSGKMRQSLLGKVLLEADYVVDDKTSPKSYEMRMKDRKGREKHVKGIYEITEKGELRICFRDGNGEVAPKSFDTKANAGAQLTVYERVK